MRLKNKKVLSRNHLLAIAAAVLLIGIASAVAFLATGNSSTTKDQTASDPMNIEKLEQYDKEKKQDFIKNAPTPSDENTGESKPSSDISLSARQDSSSQVTVLTNLSSTPYGTCTLTISNGSKKITKTAEVIYQPQFSSCAGFAVNIDELGTGSWTIELAVTTDSLTETKSITLEVK